MSTWDWHDDAACRKPGVDASLFFTRDGETAQASMARAGRAKAVCATCPVIAECGAYAMETRQDGVWGGTDDKERRRLRRNGQKQRTRRMRQREAA